MRESYCYHHADINECTESEFPCDDNAQCLNTEGSYECRCYIGYTGNGSSCIGIILRLVLYNLHDNLYSNNNMEYIII